MLPMNYKMLYAKKYYMPKNFEVFTCKIKIYIYMSLSEKYLHVRKKSFNNMDLNAKTLP